MNAYEIVERILEEKKSHISLNELDEIAKEEKDIVIAILKSKYKGEYFEGYDAHCCGQYCFENPYLKKEKGYTLQYCFHYSDKWESIICGEGELDEEMLKNFDKEIHRLDEPSLPFNFLKENHFMIGINRLWRIKEIYQYWR